MKANSILSSIIFGILVSSGSIGSIYGQETPLTSMPPLSVQTEIPIYSAGATVNILGQVKSLNENFDQAVTIRILDNTGNLVGIGQVMPDLQGKFTFQITSGGTWKNSGEYKIVVNYGAQKAENTFDFTGGEEFVAPPPPSSTICGPNEILVGGECIEKEREPPLPKCGPNEILVNGQCMEPEPVEPPPTKIDCEPGEKLVDDRCVVVITEHPEGNGCLIATAAFGSELAPQVQFLREIRDSKVLSTSSGSYFMMGFNDLYYSFSPTIADWERQNPIFKEGVKLFITPMISSLSLLSLAEPGSEVHVLILGISIIALNIGIYILAPFSIAKRLVSSKNSK